jgi:hypothetical protein
MRAAVAFLLATLLPGVDQEALAQERWRLTETLRIGSPDDGPYLFSDVRGVAVNARGEIFVLDFKVQEIRQFDAQGKFVKRVVRVGSGPGEIRNANGILSTPGGQLWVNDPANGRFSVFSAAGEFVRQLAVSTWGYGYIWNGMVDRTGVLHEFFPVQETPRAESRPFIRRFHPVGKIDTLPLPSCADRTGRSPEQRVFFGRGAGRSRTMSVPFLPSPTMTWDPRGFVWCSSSDRYEVLQLGIARGDTLRRITLNVEPIEVTRAERDAAIARVRAAFQELGVPDPDFGLIPRTKPVIQALDVDDTGRLWVRRTGSDTTKTLFDVWDDRGRHLAQLEAPFRISPYWHPVIRGNTLYTVVVDEDDVPYVVRARIDRP